MPEGVRETPSMDDIGQPAAARGVRIRSGVRDGGGLNFDLPEVLDAIGSFVYGLTWEVRFISSVWMDSDPWLDSWADEPLRLDSDALRARWVGQIINGRFAAFDGAREVLMIEAVDSSFWLVWSDDATVLSALTSRFDDATPVTPPTPFGIHG